MNRPVRIDFDFLAQAAHRDPHVRSVSLIRVGPAASDERLGGDDLAQVRGQGVQQARFGGSEPDLAPAYRRRPAMQVERQVRAEDERLAWDTIAQPAQDALNSGAQLRVVVRLGDVVLGDFVEQASLAVGGVDGGKDDDRKVRLGLYLAGQGQAVDARHHQVEQDQVGPARLQATQRLLAVASGRHVVAVVAQLLGQHDQQVGVVVDEQDPLCPWLDHSRCLPPPFALTRRGRRPEYRCGVVCGRAPGCPLVPLSAGRRRTPYSALGSK